MNKVAMVTIWCSIERHTAAGAVEDAFGGEYFMCCVCVIMV